MERKLRVGFADIDDATSWSSWSGTPRNMLNALRRHPDVEVELISPLKTSLKWLYLPWMLKSRIAKEDFQWRREDWSLRYFAAQIESAFREKKLDAVFSPSSIPVTRLKSTVPFVFWTDAIFHGLGVYYSQPNSKRTLKTGQKQEEAALSGAHFACYSSDWSAKAAMKFISPDRVKVLPFGPNIIIEHTRGDVENWITERRKARPQSCNLLWVGVDWSRKGGSVAVETARRLIDAGVPTTLRVIGRAPSEPLPSFVEVIGFVDKKQPEGYKTLTDAFRSSDIFILPSRAELSAIVLAEAAAFGLPALTCDTGGLADYVVNDRNGFRVPVEDDGMLFAEKAKMILSNYQSFARNAYAEFEARLNWDASVQLLVELLKRASRSRAVLQTTDIK